MKIELQPQNPGGGFQFAITAENVAEQVVLNDFRKQIQTDIIIINNFVPGTGPNADLGPTGFRLGSHRRRPQ